MRLSRARRWQAS